MTVSDPGSLDTWIERQVTVSAERLLAVVSATGLRRPGPWAGKEMVPARGCVLAAAEAVPGPDEPDYFFHWIRDAALVMRALLSLRRRGRLPERGAACFADSLAFDRRLARIDGRKLVSAEGWPPPVRPELRQWLRSREEIEALHGAAVAADARYNPDGSPDLLRWGRPQHDGPALRALTTMELLESDVLSEAKDRRRAQRFLTADLDFCLARYAQPCFDPWEEEFGHHFHTRLVQYAALVRGSVWAEAGGHSRRARCLSAGADALAEVLVGHWSPTRGIYRSRLPGPGVSRDKELDASVLLAVLHAGLSEGPFSVLDPRVGATVATLERFFAEELALNAGRGPADGVALGRYAGDRYFEGGAWPVTGFGLAEFHYLRAAGHDRAKGKADLARGDAVLSFLRQLLPEDGRIPEQLDRSSGAPRSARDLAWSHAAFVAAVDARMAVRDRRAHGLCR